MAVGAGGGAAAPIAWMPDATGGASARRPHTIWTEGGARAAGSALVRVPPWAGRYAVPLDATLN